jgi:adhesin transport system outer membrane protein
MRQMLFDGMATYNEVKRQKAATDAKSYTVFGQSEISALNATEAYLDVLRREELVQLAKENLTIHQRTNDQIRLRSEKGVGKKADTEQSMGRLDLAESNYRSEAGNLEDAKTTYLRVIGALPGKLEAPVDPASGIPATLDEAIDMAVNNHPILKSANSDVEEADAQHDTAMAPYFPRVDVVVGSSRNNNLDGIPGPNSDLYALLELNYNIANGGKDVARRDETAKLINQSKDIRDNTYRQVVESMRLSWVAYQTVKSQMDFFKGHRDASIKANDAYQKQFNIGQRTLLDLLDSANEMYTAKSQYVSAKYDELFAKYRILTSMGGLNNYLQVKLPEEIKPVAQEDKS